MSTVIELELMLRQFVYSGQDQVAGADAHQRAPQLAYVIQKDKHISLLHPAQWTLLYSAPLEMGQKTGIELIL